MRLRLILEFGHFESLAQLVDLRTHANGVAGNQRRASPRSGRRPTFTALPSTATVVLRRILLPRVTFLVARAEFLLPQPDFLQADHNFRSREDSKCFATPEFTSFAHFSCPLTQDSAGRSQICNSA